MKGRIFAFNLILNIIINAFISFAIATLDAITISLSIPNPSMNMAPYVLPAFVAPVLVGTIIGTIFLMIVPVNKLTDDFALSLGAKRGEGLFIPLKLILLVLIMVVVMSFSVHMILYYLGMNPIFPPGTIATLADWINPIPSYYPVAYIAAITTLPLGLLVASKISGFDPRKMPDQSTDSMHSVARDQI